MDGVLWYVLAGARGGPNRIRILRELDERPWNANQLAQRLDLDYTTVRHHLDVLCEHGLVTDSGEGYGRVYLLSEWVESNWDDVEAVIEAVE